MEVSPWTTAIASEVTERRSMVSLFCAAANEAQAHKSSRATNFPTEPPGAYFSLLILQEDEAFRQRES
jgi:hypothetical protein